MRAARLYSGTEVMSVPSRIMLPESRGNVPLIRLSKVVFPEPLEPTIETNSPFLTEREKLLKMQLSLTVPTLVFIDIIKFNHHACNPLFNLDFEEKSLEDFSLKISINANIVALSSFR